MQTVLVDSVGCSPEDLASALSKIQGLEKVIFLKNVDCAPQMESFGFRQCHTCSAFVPLGSEAESCLFHPGVYSGYGASCSSYECCFSAQPGYVATPGCTFAKHTFEGEMKRQFWRWRRPLMELFDAPYDMGLFPPGFRWLECTQMSRHGREYFSLANEGDKTVADLCLEMGED